MARKARQKSLYSTYWIEQTCTDTDFFTDDAERAYFLSCLKRGQQQYGFYLIGYRLERCGYQLLIYDNGNDITKIMRTLNIEYALKVNRDAFKLKSRFKSKQMLDNASLLDAISKMSRDRDCNPYNSYSHNCVTEGHMIHDTIAMTIFSHNRDTYTAFIRNQISLLEDAIPSKIEEPRCEKKCIKTRDEGKRQLEQLLLEKHLSYDQMLADKPLRNALIHYFRKNSLLSLKDIGDLFGGMSESAISKLIKRQLAIEPTGGKHVIHI